MVRAHAPSAVCTVVAGDDAFRRRQARVALQATVADPADPFAVHRLSARGLTARALETILETPPLFSPRTVLVIDDGTQLAAETSARLLRTLQAAHAAGRTDLTVLMEWPTAAGPPKAWRDAGVQVVLCASLRRSDAVVWIREYAATTHGVRLARDAAEALVEALGAEASGPLAQTVDGLVAQVAGAPITAAVIHQTVTPHVPTTPYALYDAVGQRAVLAASRALAALQRNPEYPAVRILIGLTGHLSALALARACLDHGVSPDAEFRGYYGEKLVQGARGWTAVALARALEALAVADAAIKSGHPNDLALRGALLTALTAVDPLDSPSPCPAV